MLVVALPAAGSDELPGLASTSTSVESAPESAPTPVSKTLEGEVTAPEPAEVDDTKGESSTPSEDTDGEDSPRPEADVGAASDEKEGGKPSKSRAASARAATLSVTLSQATGTGPFDADNAAGHDSGAGNDVIRTNDTITYTAGVRYEGGDQTDPTITFTLPQGEELVSLPPFCLSGSSVTPTALPAPAIPVTATTWTTLPTQTVSCRIADQNSGTSLDYKFVSKVRSEVPHGTVLGPFNVSATSAEVTIAAESATVTHRVSAAANFDISKRATSTTDNTGPLYGAWISCSFDPSRSCRSVEYPLTINTPSGGKGITPLASPITVTDDLSPNAFYGPGTTNSPEWTAAGAGALDKYGARLTKCDGGPLNIGGSIPNSRISGGASTPANSVRSSGTITCTQANPGAPAQITFTNADTTAYTVPTTSAGNSALPANTSYVISTGLRVEIPLDAITDLGEDVDGTQTLAFTNMLVDFEATDITGEPNQGEDPSNNVRNTTARTEEPGGFSKGFSGVTGAPGNTPIGTGGFSRWEYEGPPGSGTLRDGNTVVVPGQTVLSNLVSTEELPPGTGTAFSRTRMMCDTWDETTLRMPRTFDSPAHGTTRVQWPSNGSPAWVSSWFFGGTWQPATTGLANLSLQYGYTATPGHGASSSCNEGTWADTPGGVPGAEVQDGLWTGVNRVRVVFSSHAPGAGASGDFDVNAAIALRVVNTGDPIGAVLPNWASLRQAPGVQTTAELVASTTASQLNSSYTPATHVGVYGDRLTLGTAAARVKKFVRNPMTQEFVDTAVPQYTAGANVDFRLNPSLTADVNAGVKAPVVVEDCLPRYQAFVSSVRPNGDPISPVVVRDGAPEGSELACPAGQTYIKWDLGEQTVNETIAPIIYSVEVLDTVRNGVYTNTAVISTPGDQTRLSARSDTAQIEVVTPTGIKIAKTVDKQIVEVNPTDVATPRTLTWAVEFANIDASGNIADVDVIDVLPANGINGSDFDGSLRFDSAAAAAGTGITILYTKNAPAGLEADPDDGSNGAAGATTWCSAATGGTVESGNGTAADCPEAAAEVTGLRFIRDGEFTPDDQFRVNVKMTPIGNSGGDVYENRTAGRAAGVTQPVGPAIRTAKVIESAIGNRVWEDVNANGIQDDGEPGVADWPVQLTGTDLDGNPVSLSTTTNENGTYSFKGLASGTYKVAFDPNGLTSNTKFTQRNAGSDDEIDSDADVVTGETAEITLASDSQDPTWDVGVVIDRNVAITIDKKFVGQTPLDKDNKSTVTYDVVVANSGTAEGVYDVADELKFGGNIVIDEVSASNTDPGDIVVNPNFDGIDDTSLAKEQKLGGGKSHTYRVTVGAQVKTEVTKEQLDCSLVKSEKGTGFLNEASLTVDSKKVTDTACGEPPAPPKPPADNGDDKVDNGDNVRGDDEGDDNGLLPNTGGPAWWIGLAALLSVAGGSALVIRKRRDDEEDVGHHRAA